MENGIWAGSYILAHNFPQNTLKAYSFISHKFDSYATSNYIYGVRIFPLVDF